MLLLGRRLRMALGSRFELCVVEVVGLLKTEFRIVPMIDLVCQDRRYQLEGRRSTYHRESINGGFEEVGASLMDGRVSE